MFIEQAYKGDNAAWKVILTSLLTCSVFIANFVYLFFFTSPEEMAQMYEMLKTFPKNLMLVANLAPFAILLGLLLLLVYALHHRGLLSLTTSRKAIDFSRVFFSMGLIVLLTLVTFGISYYLDASDLVWNFDAYRFGVLLVISVLLFPVQIAFEEYLFRGYLMQQLGVASGSRALPFLLTSILFGLFHSANPEVAEMGFGVMAFYIGTGLLLAAMTLMDEGIELSLGFHLGNNLMAALLVTSDFSALQTDAVFRYTAQKDSHDLLMEMIVTMLVTYPLILVILARKYKWADWREKLFGKVSKPISITPSTVASHEENT